MHNSDEILAAIYPAIRMCRAAGHEIEVETDKMDNVVVRPRGGMFPGLFINAIAAACMEERLTWSIGANNNKPFILF